MEKHLKKLITFIKKKIRVLRVQIGRHSFNQNVVGLNSKQKREFKLDLQRKTPKLYCVCNDTILELD